MQAGEAQARVAARKRRCVLTKASKCVSPHLSLVAHHVCNTLQRVAFDDVLTACRVSTPKNPDFHRFLE
jgi:hypothetical protein